MSNEPQTNGAIGLKILMLHGYTQSGQLFRAKTRVLEKHLQKLFPGATFTYPDGPISLKPSDIPGFDSSTVTDPDEIEAYGWWRRSDTSNPPEYVGLVDRGLSTIAATLTSEGPFDGVIGFSQGAAAAAMVASLLEGRSRQEAFVKARQKSPVAIPYPTSFEALRHPPMKFCVSYSGFIAPGERYRGFYEQPHITTPVCSFVGSLDTVVDESRTQALIDASGGEGKMRVVIHPGGHFVPTSKEYLNALGQFIKISVEGEQVQERKEDEKVEDMEVPF